MRNDLIELIDKINELPKKMMVQIDPNLDYNREFSLEPVTISCEDKTIIAYIITNKQVY